MPEPTPLAKAELRQVDASFENEIARDTWTTVQFNPEALKVSYANQVVTPESAGDQRGKAALQFVGTGSTKLSLQLWFDVTGQQEGEVVEDVRLLTRKVAFFITPQEQGTAFVPPAVRFLWGSFQFDGIMESLDESLEFFSPEGRPLRASLSFSLSQQRITHGSLRDTGGIPQGLGGAGLPVGTAPLLQAPAGATLQALAAHQGQGSRWKEIATANGIENPRRLAPGQLIDLQRTLGARRR